MLNTLVPDEAGFQPVRVMESAPVPDETALQNIEASTKFDHPVLKCTPRRTDLGTVIFVAGGPTMRDGIEEIRRRQGEGVPVMTSNNTYDYLIDRGIVPDMCLLFDPKKRVAGYITKPDHKTKFYLAMCVAPGVFEHFQGFDVTKVLIAYGVPKNADIELQHRLYPRSRVFDYLVGGTMTPLRAIPFVRMLGYTRIEFYGFDSCFSTAAPPIVYEHEQPERYAELAQRGNVLLYEDTVTKEHYVIDEPDDGGYFYAYKKQRPEDITVAEVGGRRFLTSPAFAYQAKQIDEWAERFEGRLEIVIHGDSLSSHLLATRKAEREAMQAAVGDRRWTEAYANMQRQMHEPGNYGVHSGGKKLARTALPILGMYETLGRTITALDYGCGDGSLGSYLTSALKIVEVTSYDPFHPAWGGDREVGVHDFTFCLDVMEHVEAECVPNVFKWIAERTRLGAYFEIALGAAIKSLPDGRNAHITVRQPEWWVEKLRPWFNITETSMESAVVKIVCERHGAHEAVAEEQAKAVQLAA